MTAPTDEELQRELYHIATLDPATALRRWKTLIEPHPPEEYGFRVVRLLPAVWNNLKKTRAVFPGSEFLESKYTVTRTANQKLESDCRALVELLDSHGIESVVLKGLVWSRIAHQDLGVRPACDFDILIKPEQADLAWTLLSANGWESDWKHWCPEERLFNAVSFSKNGRKLDLHWSLLWECRDPESNSCFWQEKEPFELSGYSAWTLSFRHHLFHLAVSANRESFHQARYLYDLSAFLKAYPERVAEHIPHVHQMLRQRHLLYRLESLPLIELGWSQLLPNRRATALDRLWSMASGHPRGPYAELLSGLFPFLDYWFHYRGSRMPGWSLRTYLVRRLEIESSNELARRVLLKMRRLVSRE